MAKPTIMVPMCSISQPSALTGRTAAELIEEELSAGPGFQHRDVIFEPELIVRQSTASRE